MKVLNQLRFLMLLICVILGWVAWGGYHDAQERKVLRQALDAHGVRVAATVEKMTWKKDEPLADVNADIAYVTADGQTVHTHVPISQIAKDGVQAGAGNHTLDVRYLPENPGRAMWVEEEPDEGIFSIWAGEATGSLLFLLAAIQPTYLPILVMGVTGVRLIHPDDDLPEARRRRRVGRVLFAAFFSLVILGAGVFLYWQNNGRDPFPGILIGSAVLALVVFVYLSQLLRREKT